MKLQKENRELNHRIEELEKSQREKQLIIN